MSERPLERGDIVKVDSDRGGYSAAASVRAAGVGRLLVQIEGTGERRIIDRDQAIPALEYPIRYE